MLHFQTDNYSRCEWLTGCNNRSRLFCLPCLLFSSEKNLCNRSGFFDLSNLHKLIKRQASSKAHLQSIIKEKTFGKIRTEHALDDQLRLRNEQHNQLVRKNREVLRKFNDRVCFLGEHELGFRGHNESENSVNKGNYVDLINFLAKYDPIMKEHLESWCAFKGTLNIIQNDLIQCIGDIVLKNIICEVQQTQFVSIILDETTDVANFSQLSKVIRYVTKTGDVKEIFLGFTEISSQRTAAALYDIVQKIIVDELNCENKIIAQSYDGAAVMARGTSS